MPKMRYVIETDKGYGKDIVTMLVDDPSIWSAKILEYTDDVNEAHLYVDETDVNAIAYRLEGKVIPVLVREFVEVIE